MTVAVAVTLVVAVAGGCRWIWVRRASGARLLVQGRAMWIPGQFRVPPRPGELREEMAAYEVIVRNRGEGDAVIEAWGITARNGGVLHAPPGGWEHTSLLTAPLSCPVPCRARARDHAHRWLVPAGYLEDWCAAERVRLEDVRPWVRRASDGKVILARRWGFPGDEIDDPGPPRWPARRWPAGRHCSIRTAG